MTEFKVVSRGAVMPGADANRVQDNLCRAFRLPPEKARTLIERPLVLKRFDNETAARAFLARIRQHGLSAVIRTSAPAQSQMPMDAKTTPALSKSYIAELFDRQVPSIPLTTRYRLGLLACGLAAFTAPLLYLSLICLFLWLDFRYLLLFPWFQELDNQLASIVYFVGIGIIPVAITLFLLAPLFVGSGKQKNFELKRSQAPLLFALADKLAASFGIAAPEQIRVTNEVNASAGSDGLMDLIRGQQILTLGLPLIRGLNTRQLVFVMAHEFGHFKQRGTRLVYHVVMSVNFWFWNRAHNTDWEDRLNALSERIPVFFVTIPAWMAGKTILLFRHLFHWLAKLNLYVTSPMSRQMEFDADAYGTYVAGSSIIRDTSCLVHKLSLASSGAHHFNVLQWEDRRLAGNITEAVFDELNRNEQNYQRDMERQLQETEIHPWATHPPDLHRIEAGEQKGYDGFFHLEEDSCKLFRDFDSLARQMTLFEYRQCGIRNPEQYLMEESKQKKLREQKNREDEALTGFFNDMLYYRLIDLDANLEKPPADRQSVVDTLRQQAQVWRQTNEDWFKCNENLNHLSLAQRLAEQDIELDLPSWGVNSAAVETLDSVISSLQKTQQQREKILAELDALWGLRIRFAIASMTGQTRDEAQSLYQAVQLLRKKLFSPLLKLARLESGYEWIYQRNMEAETSGSLWKLTDHFRLDTYSASVDVLARADKIDYCYLGENLNFGAQMIDIAGGRIRDADRMSASEIGNYASSVQATTWRHYFRLLSCLGWLCQQSEEAAGIRPIRLLPKKQ